MQLTVRQHIGGRLKRTFKAPGAHKRSGERRLRVVAQQDVVMPTVMTVSDHLSGAVNAARNQRSKADDVQTDTV